MNYQRQIQTIPHFHIIRSAEARLLKDLLVDCVGPFLDIGCGDGRFGGTLEIEGIYGVDIDRGAIKRMAPGGPYRSAFFASASQLPFPDGFFNTVFSNCALEHMEGIDAVLRETARVLKKNGQFVFTVPTAVFLKAVEGDEVLKSLGLNTKVAIDEYNRFHRHLNIFTPKEWKERLEVAGLKTLALEHYLPGEIGSFVARMDVLYTIEADGSKAMRDRLEGEYKSLLSGYRARRAVGRYLKDPHHAKDGTHIIVKAEKI